MTLYVVVKIKCWDFLRDHQILEVDPKAPLINALITRPTGLPGVGVGNYFANKYKVEGYRKWSNVSAKKKGNW